MRNIEVGCSKQSSSSYRFSALPALLRLRAVSGGVTFLAAVEALVGFGTVILHMTLERVSIKVIEVIANGGCSHTSFLHFLHTSGSGQSELLWPS